MSEEEKKAIELLKDYVTDFYHSYNEKAIIKAIATLLNLIEKQNNRLEQLEKENKKLTEARNWYFEHTVNKAVTPEMLHKILRQDYIPKSVIREKIKHYEECEEFYGSMETTDKYSDGVIVDEICKVLRKILGEEQ